MTSEPRYLAALVRAAAAPSATSAPPPPPPDLDAPAFARLLDRHALLLPSLTRVLPTDALPAPVAEQVRATTRRVKETTALLWFELARALPRLRDAGIEPLVLKGPALAATLYPAVEERAFTDLDLLVPRDALDAAAAALAPLGYTLAPTSAHPEFHARHHFHRILANRAGLRIELHWDLTEPASYVRFDTGAIRARARRVMLAGVEAHVSGPEDLLLHVAAQGLDTADAFCDLRRVIDAARLVQAGAGVAPEVAAGARAQGVGPALWVQLGLVATLTGARPAPALVDALRPRGFAATCLDRLALPEKSLRGAIRDRPGLGYLVRWMCAPTRRAMWRDVGAFLVPGEAHHLQRGVAPDRLPGLAPRTALTLDRIGYFAKLAAWQLWHVLTHRDAHGGDTT